MKNNSSETRNKIILLCVWRGEDKVSLCSPVRPGSQRSTYLCLLSAVVNTTHHHTWSKVIVFMTFSKPIRNLFPPKD